jgi:hypothetical protein
LKVRVLFFYFAFVIIYITNAYAEVNCLLINKKDVLELVITDTKLANLGSWIFFMSNNVDEGSDVPIAGVKGVGHKIEDGRLSRYEDSYENKWRDLGPVKIVKNNQWQIVIIPKGILFKATENKGWKGIINWRLVLFPHNIKTAFYIPKEQAGRLNLRNELQSDAATLNSINFSHFYDYSIKGTDKALAFGDGVLSNNSFQHKKKSINIKINFLNSALNEVQKYSLWWPNLNKFSYKDLAKENNLGLLVPKRIGSVIFSPLKLFDKEEKEIILKARCYATQHSNRRAFFMVNSIDDFPMESDGIILSWAGDIEKEIKLLNEIRKNYSGEIFAFMGRDFSLSKTHKRVLSISAFLKYKVYPILPPDESIEMLSHKEIILFLWLKQHIDYIKEEGKELQKLFPIPLAVHQKEFIQKKKFAINVYKESLINVMKKEFSDFKGLENKE